MRSIALRAAAAPLSALISSTYMFAVSIARFTASPPLTGVTAARVCSIIAPSPSSVQQLSMKIWASYLTFGSGFVLMNFSASMQPSW